MVCGCVNGIYVLTVLIYNKYTCCLIALGCTSRKEYLSALTDTYPLTIKGKIKEGIHICRGYESVVPPCWPTIALLNVTESWLKLR